MYLYHIVCCHCLCMCIISYECISIIRGQMPRWNKGVVTLWPEYKHIITLKGTIPNFWMKIVKILCFYFLLFFATLCHLQSPLKMLLPKNLFFFNLGVLKKNFFGSNFFFWFNFFFVHSISPTITTYHFIIQNSTKISCQSGFF